MMNDKPTILVIEDEPAIGAALVKFLQNQGYEPTLCGSGACALSTIDGFTPDAVITDIHLPDINGLVLSKTLRDRFGDSTPIIVLSADTSTEVIKSLSHVGATYFLNKPINLALLSERLASYLQATK